MADYLSNQGAGRFILTGPVLLGLAALLLLCLGAAKARVDSSFHADDYTQIRVVLSDSKTYVEVGGALSWQINGKYICDSTDVAEIKLVDSDTVKLVLGKKGWSNQRIVAVPKKGFLRFGGREYRGRMEFYPSRDGDTVIALNVLPLEDYLLGVVPAEMPPSWPAEALKSQAVAARTYAVFEMREKRTSSKSYTFDVYPDVSDQVYKGVSGEDPRASKAVKDTAGVIMTWQGKPIFAQFCADCGGSTKCGTQPYLQAVPCYAPDSPYNDWSIKLSPDKLSSLARAAGGSVGTVREVRAENDSTSGHLKTLSIVGDGGSQSISGSKLRDMLGLSTMKSTRAYISGPGGSVLEPQKPKFGQNAAGSSPGKQRGRQPLPRQPQEATDVFAAASGGAADGDGDGFIPDALDGAEAGTLESEANRSRSKKSPPRTERRQAVMSIELPSLSELEDSSRPVVLYGKGIADLKLRNAFIFDGRNLRKPLQVCTVLGTQSTLETLEYDLAVEDEGPAEQAEAAGYDEEEPLIEAADIQERQESGDIAAATPAPPAEPETPQEARFQLEKAPKSEIPPSSRLKVGSDGIVLRGSGYGHGVGLSQWGAKELASQGLDYLSILLHFYSGVDIYTIEPPLDSKPKDKGKKKKTAEAEEAEAGEAVDVFYKPFQR
ncbi:SpoIID/LytB domain-containing protein [bacterium]|nr:SpoIID/LytB domain-containing protein [bacterium]